MLNTKGVAINQYLNHHTVDVVISCSIPSAKYMIDDGKCQAPVIEMLHAQPSVQFPILSDLERAALAKCKILQLLLPSGVKLAHQYFPDLPVVVIGNAVNPIMRKANLVATKNSIKLFVWEISVHASPNTFWYRLLLALLGDIKSGAWNCGEAMGLHTQEN